MLATKGIKSFANEGREIFSGLTSSVKSITSVFEDNADKSKIGFFRFFFFFFFGGSFGVSVDSFIRGAFCGLSKDV